MNKGPIQLELQDQALRRMLCRCARQSAGVAGAFVLIVAAMLVFILLRQGPPNLVSEPGVDVLKKQLVDQGGEALKTRIREEDRHLRQGYFRQVEMLRRGAWLLAGGGAALALFLKLGRDLGMKPYLPTEPAPQRRGPDRKAAWALAASAGIFAAVLLGLSRQQGDIAANNNNAQQKTAAPALAGGQWPALRGPGNRGQAQGDYPTQWDATTGQNILWKTPLPLPGKNSPVVCGNQVFLSGASAQRREIYCVDADSGTIRWTRSVGTTPATQPSLAEDTGFAPSTMAVDGKRVFAIFPTGDLACFDLEGNELWSKNLGPLNNQYGHASSLLAEGGRLFIQLDQGKGPEEEGEAASGKSALLALDGGSGNLLWRTPRQVGASWSTPMLSSDPVQLITLAQPWVIAYDPQSGAEIWRAKGLSGDIVASPVIAGGLVYVGSESSPLWQIRLDGRGDVTRTHMRRIDCDVSPDIPSLAAAGQRILVAKTSGAIALVDGKSASTLWVHRFDDTSIHASPLAVGDHFYLVDDQGVTHVIQAADEFRELGHWPLGQDVSATPALAGGRIFIRGQSDLFCIAEKSR